MSPIYLHTGKILLRNNKIATNQNCCCVTPTFTPTLTPTLTLTPTPSMIIKPGCDCDFSIGNVCSSVTWSMNNMYDAGGNQVDITDTVNFAGTNFQYVSPTNPSVEMNFGIQCNVIDKKLFITFSVSSLFAPGGTISYYCKPNGNPADGVFNGQTWTKNIEVEECDDQGFADLSGNYNLDPFGINCPNGDATFQAAWSISQPPCQ